MILARFFGKKLHPTELGEIRALTDLIRCEKFKLEQVKGNTLNVEDGKKWVKTQEGIVQLLDNAKANLISQCLQRLGYPQGTPVSLDLATGKTWKT